MMRKCENRLTHTLSLSHTHTYLDMQSPDGHIGAHTHTHTNTHTHTHTYLDVQSPDGHVRAHREGDLVSTSRQQPEQGNVPAPVHTHAEQIHPLLVADGVDLKGVCVCVCVWECVCL
jgi:hypothetical protein